MRGTWLFMLLAVTNTASAQDDPRFSISVGAFFTDRESQTRIDGEAGRGTDVDLEDDLGLTKSDTVFRVDGYWRFAEKHRFDFSAFDLSRSSTKQIDKEIVWNDTTYPINSTVEADLDLTIYKAGYTWMFLKRNRSFLGATVGLYIADIGAELSTSGGGSVESDDLTAPLPIIGLRGEYRFADRWSLRGSGEVFAVDYGDYEGSLYDLFAGLDFSVTETIAIGVGVNSVKLDVGVSKDNFQGDIDWQYDGALAYLKFDF
ncbi:hypothetical protein [Marinobacter sp. LN3S78]|uniref:hypothetical protein n=1 Tax=Marinobacter sp. LN3S78 TaxID=3382300 RepID=UPI00387B95F4